MTGIRHRRGWPMWRLIRMYLKKKSGQAEKPGKLLWRKMRLRSFPAKQQEWALHTLHRRHIPGSTDGLTRRSCTWHRHTTKAVPEASDKWGGCCFSLILRELLKSSDQRLLIWSREQEWRVSPFTYCPAYPAEPEAGRSLTWRI